MMVRNIIIGAVIIIFMCIGLVVLRVFIKPNIEKYAKAEAPKEGRFVTLDYGDVYYEIAGPDTGAFVLMVHGSIVYNISWDRNFYELAKAGFRVIRFDLYGRGYSSRPKIAYTKSLYLNQMKQLLEYLHQTEHVHLIGLSMGGAFAAMFAQKYPQFVQSVILVDTVTPHFWQSNNKKVFKNIFGKFQKTVGKKSETYKQRMETVRPLLNKMKNQFKYEGVTRSIYSGIKYLKNIDLVSAYKELGSNKLPTLLIWGELDDVVPITESKDIIQLVPQIQFHTIKGAGHLVQYEKPEEVNRILIDFLSKNS